MNLDPDFDNHKYMDIKNENGLNVTEQKLYDALKLAGLYPKPQYKIDRTTVDFAFPEYKLVIEVNGVYHDTPEQIERDKNRMHFLEREGWNIKIFRAEEVIQDPYIIVKEIEKLLIKLGYKTSEEEAAGKNSKQFSNITTDMFFESEELLRLKKDLQKNHPEIYITDLRKTNGVYVVSATNSPKNVMRKNSKHLTKHPEKKDKGELELLDLPSLIDGAFKNAEIQQKYSFFGKKDKTIDLKEQLEGIDGISPSSYRGISPGLKKESRKEESIDITTLLLYVALVILLYGLFYFF